MSEGSQWGSRDDSKSGVPQNGEAAVLGYLWLMHYCLPAERVPFSADTGG